MCEQRDASWLKGKTAYILRDVSDEPVSVDYDAFMTSTYGVSAVIFDATNQVVGFYRFGAGNDEVFIPAGYTFQVFGTAAVLYRRA